MSDFQKDARFQIMRLLEARPDLSQREIASELSISLGAVNYCLKALVAKGYVKVHNFSVSERKWRYAYVLTPQGVLAKARLTRRFLSRKLAEYEALKEEIAALRSELPRGGKPASDGADDADIGFQDGAERL
ncbi:MarR family EPS-associated transcriptional regulator [Amorphus sp. 3PC139-8]|uniref:MarR family EPS-associated transcriptional regulator n=1 Tax=Amorphus sp. 3PC139-8 TaxID=2735676 RepID=UPI00345D2E5F